MISREVSICILPGSETFDEFEEVRGNTIR